MGVQLINQMNKLFSLLLCVVAFPMLGQSYKEISSFKADLWTIVYAEEAVYAPNDTNVFTWVKRTIKPKNDVVYIDISKDNTLIGIKLPNKLKLSSEGLPNNGFKEETWFNQYSMYIQSYAKDEQGNTWLVTVGKDSMAEEGGSREQGRIYISIQAMQGRRTGWYFILNSFGK